MRKLFLILLVATSAPALAQSATAGEKVFSKCKLCHQVGETAKNGIGPQLNGVVGRPAGSVAGFAYSAAIKGSGITWDEARFSQFIADPKETIPDTKMPFDGIKDDREVKDLIAFLKQFDATGKRAP